MITTFKEIEELFAEINNSMSKKVKVYVIGGAALLRRGMKAATKDIDLVVETKNEFFEIQNALNKLKFISQNPGKEKRPPEPSRDRAHAIPPSMFNIGKMGKDDCRSTYENNHR